MFNFNRYTDTSDELYSHLHSSGNFIENKASHSKLQQGVDDCFLPSSDKDYILLGLFIISF